MHNEARDGVREIPETAGGVGEGMQRGEEEFRCQMQTDGNAVAGGSGPHMTPGGVSKVLPRMLLPTRANPSVKGCGSNIGQAPAVTRVLRGMKTKCPAEGVCNQGECALFSQPRGTCRRAGGGIGIEGKSSGTLA